MTSPVNLTTNPDGSQTLKMTGVDLTIDDIDPDTGTGSITITAAGGFAHLPNVLQGLPGLPPVFPAGQITTTQVPHGTAVPATNPAVTVIDPGGPGLASQYGLEFFINSGADGNPGSFALAAAVDVLEATATILGQSLVVTQVTPSLQFGFASQMGQVYYPSVINSTGTSGGSNRTIATVPIPSLAYACKPVVSCQTLITPTDGTAQVNLVARLGNATTGPIIGQGFGLPGQTCIVNIAFGPAAGSAPSVGVVNAATPTNVYFNVEQVGGTTGAFTTAAATTWGCGVAVFPIR